MPSLSLWIKFLRGLFIDMYFGLRIAAFPTLLAIWNSPSLLLEPRELSRTFMAFVWVPFGDGIDQNSRQDKDELIRPWASGVVLDIGAAHGHLAPYLDRTRVTAYIALEPNLHMHVRLRAKAREAGFVEAEGTFLLLPCGAEDVECIKEILGQWARRWGREEKEGRVVDTLVSVLTLCSLPSLPSSSSSSSSSSSHSSSPSQSPSHPSLTPSTPPAMTVRALQTCVLRPGGQLLFYEHVRSPFPVIARAQDVFAPVWRALFDGCTIGVDSVRAVWEAGFEEGEFGPTPNSTRDKAGQTKEGYGTWIEEGRMKYWKRKGVNEGGWAEMYVWGKEEEDVESLFWHQSGRCVKSG